MGGWPTPTSPDARTTGIEGARPLERTLSEVEGGSAVWNSPPLGRDGKNASPIQHIAERRIPHRFSLPRPLETTAADAFCADLTRPEERRGVILLALCRASC
jgi:hypothetical protein